jgi:hypothetical protein
VNADAEAPPLFRWASQNLAAAAMLLRGCPEAATSEERRVRQQLKALLEAAVAQQAESSASRQHSERGRAGAPSAHGPIPPPSQHRERVVGGGAATLAVTSRLGPNRDMRNTIEAQQRAESVDNHRDNRSRHHDDRGVRAVPRQQRQPRPQLVTEPERSTSLWLEHPRCEVPFTLSSFDQRAKVRRGHQPQRMA